MHRGDDGGTGAEGGVCGGDRDRARGAGQRADPDGAHASGVGEGEGVVTDERGETIHRQGDLPADVGAGRAVAVNRPEDDAGLVDAVGGQFAVVGADRQLVSGGIGREGARGDQLVA
jgi:hypothetical protein